MKLIERSIEKTVKERLFLGKVIIIYGARQVGKTTLAKKILDEYPESSRYFNCELLSVQQSLQDTEASKLKAFFGDYKLIVLDEAHHIPEIGLKLKVLVDTFPQMQIIATGSSSFDLAQKTAEPLTGRVFRFILYPLSAEEIRKSSDLVSLNANLEKLLRFGAYPEVYSLPEERARERLNEIGSDYLYKDILKFDGLKKSSIIRNLLQLLALQLGQEVSYNELATALGINRLTVQKYIDILEQSFVVFTLRAFSRNRRKEISKSVKIYFYDLGIRNSIIQNFNPLSVRDDVGALWENFCIIERRKLNEVHFRYTNTYFWRTYDQKEVDYVEEAEGAISGFEFKWKPQKRTALPKQFIKTYDASITVIHPENYWDFVLENTKKD